MKLKRFLFAVLLLAIPAIFFWVPGAIRVKAVECTSQFGPCSGVINEKLQEYRGDSLKDADKSVSDYLSSQTSVRNFATRLKLPSTLSVSIIEKKARYALSDAEEHFFAVIGEEGDVLYIQESTSLPFITTKTRLPNLGEKIPEKTLFGLKIQERLYRAYQVTKGELETDSLKASLPMGYTVYFPLDGDIDELLGGLALIIYELNRASEDSRINTSVNTIDLRFANPVLR